MARGAMRGPAKLPGAQVQPNYCIRHFRSGHSSAKLSKTLREINPSAFITNASKAHILGALVSLPKGVPLIWYMRDGLEHRPYSRKLLSLLSRRCDFTICISQYVADQVHRHVSSALPTNIVYNIIDLNAFHPGSPAPCGPCQRRG